ncbi:hypothetical protein LTR15_005443 [Elasticomyces elasticus]|nr:hypothetical protein LTR15_005443 [Elasticomyces elasticus]
MAKRKRAKDSSGGSSRKKAKATAAPVVSKLMSLAPELRNAIWGYTLLQSDDIDVDANLKIPPLICVSRQLRSEASGIWFTQNQFNHRISNCNADVALAWTWHTDARGFSSPCTMVILPSPTCL